MGEVSYKGHRYPVEIIAHCVWLYHRFPLSLRENPAPPPRRELIRQVFRGSPPESVGPPRPEIQPPSSQ